MVGLDWLSHFRRMENILNILNILNIPGSVAANDSIYRFSLPSWARDLSKCPGLPWLELQSDLRFRREDNFADSWHTAQDT